MEEKKKRNVVRNYSQSKPKLIKQDGDSVSRHKIR